jgi:hypothetical protein
MWRGLVEKLRNMFPIDRAIETIKTRGPAWEAAAKAAADGLSKETKPLTIEEQMNLVNDHSEDDVEWEIVENVVKPKTLKIVKVQYKIV